MCGNACRVVFGAETLFESLHQGAAVTTLAQDCEVAGKHVRESLGFECGENALLLLWPGGREQLALADKNDLAQSLIERIAARYAELRAKVQTT